MAQADAIFSKTRKRGAAKDVATWGDLGLTGDWAARPISLYGRNSASGTYGFFKEHVLKNGDFKDTVKEQPGSASVVQGVTNDRYGDRLQRHRLSHLRRPHRSPRREATAAPTSEGSYEDVVSKKYPLARYLYLYVNKAPGQAPRPAGQGVPEARVQPRGPGGRGEGRLSAPDRRHRRGGAAQA